MRIHLIKSLGIPIMSALILTVSGCPEFDVLLSDVDGGSDSGTGNPGRNTEPEPQTEECWAVSAFSDNGNINGPIGLKASPSGALYVVALSSGPSMTFGDVEVVSTDFEPWGSYFLARYNPDGTLSWVHPLSGEEIFGDFGVTSDGGVLIFQRGKFSRLGPEGDELWSKDMWDVHLITIETLPDDSFFVAGNYSNGDLVLGEGEPNETTLSMDSLHVVFIARYNPDGTLAWAKRVAEVSTVLDMTALSDDSFLVLGETFSGPYISLFDADANSLWNVNGSFGMDGTLETLTGLILNDGAFWVSGNLGGTMILEGDSGVITLAAPTETSDGGVVNGKYAFFGIHLSAEGEILWTNSDLMAEMDMENFVSHGGADLTVDGSILSTGDLSGSVVFGRTGANETRLSSSIPSVYIANFGADGSFERAAHLATDWDDGRSGGVVALDDGTAVVAGTFRGVGQFNTNTGAAIELSSPDRDSLFLARVCQ